jgi:ribose transport system substrate-binding protein
MTFPIRFSHRRAAAFLVAGLAAVALSACASSSSPASSPAGGGSAAAATSSATASPGLAYASKQIAQYSVNPAALTAPGAAVPGAGAALQGKTVYYIPLLSTIPNLAIIGQGLKAGDATLGASTTLCDGGANPTSVTNCINQAVTAQAAAIVLCGFPTQFAPAGIASAKAHHIPVLVMGEDSATVGDDTLAYLPNKQTTLEALAADTIIAQSKGTANVLVAEADDNSQSIGWIQNGAVPEFKKECPGCTVTVMQFDSTQLQTQVPSQVSSELLSHPGINYVLSEFDTYIPAIISGAQSAHVTNLKITGTTGILSGLQRIASGQFETADVGTNFYQYGWLGTDQLARMVTGSAPVAHPFGIKIFTAQNVKGLPLTAADQNNGTWFGSSSEWQGVLTSLWK